MDAQLQALDPLSPISHSQSFVVDLLAGVSEHKLEPAIQFLRTAPEFAFHRLLCALSLIHLGRLNEARTIVEEAPEERLPSIAGRQCAFIRHALSGHRDAALTSVSVSLRACARQVEWWSYVMADCYSLVDEKDQALDWLANAIDRGFTNYPVLSQHDKALARFYGDPRFEVLMQKAKYEWERFAV